MNTRFYISPIDRIKLRNALAQVDWTPFANSAYVAIAGDEPARILGGNNEQDSLIDQMEEDPSVGSFFVTKNPHFKSSNLLRD